MSNIEKQKLYFVWNNIKNRCNNKKHPAYKNYWGRWISYDPKWEKFQWFYNDMKEWYNIWLTIDRENNDWDYCKENCSWITRKEQARNRRSNVFYKWKCITDWCRELWLDTNKVWSRINVLWWSIEKSLEIDNN